MRINSPKPVRSGILGAALFAAIAFAALAGCGGASSDRAADSGSLSEPPQTRVASVDVTYYYLPG